MRTSSLFVVSFVAWAALPGCREPAIPPTVHVPGTPHTDEVLAVFRAAGLEPQGFAAVPPPPNTATYCEHGKVNWVETTLCEYDSDQALDRGVARVRADWARVDVHTGVILRAKLTTLEATDRERREPSGKTIAAMARLFRKL